MSGLVKGTVVTRHDWAPGLMTLGIESHVEPFVPGQFLNLGLEVGGELVFRAYSIASAPGQKLEFYLARVVDGAFSPALFELKVGDPVSVDPRPQGFFTLDWVPAAEELWMIGTGTGLAPFLSMLRSGEPQRRFSKVILVHGARHANELAYEEELQSLASRSEGRFVRVPVLSRDEAPSAALKGRVTTALDDGQLEARAGATLSPERSHVLLCGNPAMIDEMVEKLAVRGLRRHRVRKPGHITVERYWD